MRGPIILVATVLVGGAALLGLSRMNSGEPAPVPADAAVAASQSSAPAVPVALVDPSLPPIKVFKSPTCTCCTGWVEHLRAAGFTVDVTDTADMNAVKMAMGVPPEMGSCHTAEIDGVVIEGHVPAADIADFMAERPEGVRGLAVPGMPVGSPGMEMPGQPADPYDVVAFSDDGTAAVYRSHR